VAGARQIVDGPAHQPLPYGLWDAAEQRDPGDPHWQQGVTYVERCGGGGTTYADCIAVTGTGGVVPSDNLAENVDQEWRGATPFTVYAEFDCSLVGLADATTVATDALARVESWQVSNAFWTGTAGTAGGTGQTTVYPHLAENTELDDPSGAVLQTAVSPTVTGDAAVALGAVEQALAACYNGRGLIHIAPAALPTFEYFDLVQRDGDALYTPAGNRVVVGSGYTGSSPAGAAPAAGTSWIYATGPVFGYRSAVQFRDMPEAFDRQKNTAHMIASRTYLFGWECCHVGAVVNLGAPT
jgi:hypothetical protein